MKSLMTACAIIFQVVAADIVRDMENRVIGGEEAKEGRFPYMVVYEACLNEINVGICGGSLIDKYWVLTSALCACNETVGGIKEVGIGIHNASDFFNNETNQEFEKISVSHAVIHPEFDFDIVNNTVMMLKLDEPSNYTPVLLADESFDSLTPDLSVTVLGYGFSNFGNRLMEADVDVLRKEECIEVWQNYTDGKYFPRDGQFCTGFLNSGTGPCEGHEGGPLIIKKSEAEEDVQVGIVTAATCGEGPDFNEEVSYHYCWINEIIRNDKCDGFRISFYCLYLYALQLIEQYCIMDV